MELTKTNFNLKYDYREDIMDVNQVNELCMHLLTTEQNKTWQHIYYKVKCKIRMCDASPECRHCTRRSCLQLSAGPLSRSMSPIKYFYLTHYRKLLKLWKNDSTHSLAQECNNLSIHIHYYISGTGVRARLFRGLTQELVWGLFRLTCLAQAHQRGYTPAWLSPTACIGAICIDSGTF